MRPYTYKDWEAGIRECVTRDGRKATVTEYDPHAPESRRIMADVLGSSARQTPFYDNGKLWQHSESGCDLMIEEPMKETMTPYTSKHFEAGIREAVTRNGQAAKIYAFDPENKSEHQLVGSVDGESRDWSKTGCYYNYVSDLDLFLKKQKHWADVRLYSDGAALVVNSSGERVSNKTVEIRRIEWES